MARRKGNYMRRMVAMLVAAIVGFLALAAAAAYWAELAVISSSPIPATATVFRALEAQAPTQTILVYFGNSSLNPNAADCAMVFSVGRQIEKTPAVARAALAYLLSGPALAERNGGYYTSINDGVKINSLNIVDGIAAVDFDGRIEEGVGGSCRVTAIRSQITRTLMQFPTVRSVVISVDGRIDDALQP